jgi:hypothetical protein
VKDMEVLEIAEKVTTIVLNILTIWAVAKELSKK